MAHGAASGRDGARHRARPATVLVPRLDAAARGAGGRRAVRRRRGHGVARRCRRGRARRGLRRRTRPARRRAVAAGASTDAGRRRGARRRAGADAPVRAVRRLRRTCRAAPRVGRDLYRPVRALERRLARDGARRRDRAPLAGGDQGRVRRRRELLRRAGRRAGVSALHAPTRVSWLACAGRSAFGRPRKDRRMATRTEPTAHAHVSDAYEVLGVSKSASRQEIEAAYHRVALERRYQDGSWVELRDAYDLLRDPEERARYDLGLDGTASTEGRRSRNPIDRLFPPLPHGWRVAIDWVVTIVGAVAIVLAIKAWVVNPYRIPSSSMEPTLHCAVPAQGCEARTSDRVLACRFCYHLRSPKRGDIVVFKTPSLALQECGSQGTFVKRLIGLPGETWEERRGFV